MGCNHSKHADSNQDLVAHGVPITPWYEETPEAPKEVRLDEVASVDDSYVTETTKHESLRLLDDIDVTKTARERNADVPQSAEGPSNIWNSDAKAPPVGIESDITSGSNGKNKVGSPIAEIEISSPSVSESASTFVLDAEENTPILVATLASINPTGEVIDVPQCEGYIKDVGDEGNDANQNNLNVSSKQPPYTLDPVEDKTDQAPTKVNCNSPRISENVNEVEERVENIDSVIAKEVDTALVENKPEISTDSSPPNKDPVTSRNHTHVQSLTPILQTIQQKMKGLSVFAANKDEIGGLITKLSNGRKQNKRPGCNGSLIDGVAATKGLYLFLFIICAFFGLGNNTPARSNFKWPMSLNHDAPKPNVLLLDENKTDTLIPNEIILDSELTSAIQSLAYAKDLEKSGKVVAKLYMVDAMKHLDDSIAKSDRNELAHRLHCKIRRALGPSSANYPNCNMFKDIGLGLLSNDGRKKNYIQMGIKVKNTISNQIDDLVYSVFI